jgi:hypothetical protein
MSRPLRQLVLLSLGGLAAASLCLAMGACSSDPTQGYSFTASHDGSVRTVAVPIFQNPTHTYGLEVELTDAIIKEIQAKTPWRVTREGTANTTLSGTLTDSRLRRLSIGRGTGYSQELAVELTVDFDWKDVRTGKTLVSRRSFTASEAFVPATPANERIEGGQHAAIQRLARDIVAELRSNW